MPKYDIEGNPTLRRRERVRLINHRKKQQQQAGAGFPAPQGAYADREFKGRRREKDATR